MKVLRGKKAVVTGAAGGIGRSIALTLAAEGVDLYLLDIDDAKLAGTVAEARDAGAAVVAGHCDLTRPEEITASVAAILRSFGHVDILINNAGVAYFGPTEDMTADQWQRLLAINLLAPIQFIRELLPTLLAREEAHIVNVCSLAGLISRSKLAAYHASKFGLVGLSASLRAEYHGRGLGVTALCPGFVRTNMLHDTLAGMRSRRVPRWMSTSPETVAARAVRAVRRNQGLVVVTPLARLAWFLQRLSPGLVAWLSRSGKKKSRPPCVADAAGSVDLPDRQRPAA